MPVASPGFIASRPAITAPDDLLGLPLLHITSRPDAWEKWFAAGGSTVQGLTGMLFDQFATIAQAAISGLGVALLPTFLIERELENGELVPLIGQPIESSQRYYLVWPHERRFYPPLVAFRSWLEAAAEADRERKMSAAP